MRLRNLREANPVHSITAQVAVGQVFIVAASTNEQGRPIDSVIGLRFRNLSASRAVSRDIGLPSSGPDMNTVTLGRRVLSCHEFGRL